MIYGWFSLKQAHTGGVTYTYATPAGTNVMVTQISDDPNRHGTMWDDIRCVGQVTDLIRRHHFEGLSPSTQEPPTPEDLHQVRDKLP